MLINAQRSKILRHLNIEQGVSNISNATISDLPVNLLLFVAVFQNVDSFGGELYMQRIFWTLSRSLGKFGVTISGYYLYL